MGIDYRARCGIGYEVSESSELIDSEDMQTELEDGLVEYIELNCGEDFDFFQVGSEFTGDIDGIFLVLREPFKNGLDLTEAKEKLDAEVKRLLLEPQSEFGVVGGVYIF